MLVVIFFCFISSCGCVYFFMENKRLNKQIEQQQQQLHLLEIKLNNEQNIGKEFNNKNIQLNSRIENLLEQIEIMKQNLTKYENEINSLRYENKNLEIKYKTLETVDKGKEEYEKYFQELNKSQELVYKNLLNNIMEKQKTEVNKLNQESLSVMLNPLKDEIEKFKKEIEDNKIKSTRNTGIIEEKINSLTQKTTEMTTTANDLTKALRGDKKKQGDYGEMQLKILLDNAGFIENQTYYTQKAIKGEENQDYRLDFVVNIGNDRVLIIDSKFSLNNYYNYIQSENKDDENRYLNEYYKDIKNHIQELSKKEYQKAYKKFDKTKDTVDFVFMFIPQEPAYITAINTKDNDILRYAYDRKVTIVTASSLMPLLNTIMYVWTIERQKKSVEEITEIGEKLYKKLSNFVDNLRTVGTTIDRAKEQYNRAINQLNDAQGNAIQLANKLSEKLGKQNQQIYIGEEKDNSYNNK